MNIVTVAVSMLIIYLLYRVLVPWVMEQVNVARAIVESGEEPPDLEEELRKRLIKLGYINPNEEKEDE